MGILIRREPTVTYRLNRNNFNFQLNNTGIYASVATQAYQAAVTGFEKNQGVIPDYEISRNLSNVLNGTDLEMEKVRELMMKPSHE